MSNDEATLDSTQVNGLKGMGSPRLKWSGDMHVFLQHSCRMSRFFYKMKHYWYKMLLILKDCELVSILS